MNAKTEGKVPPRPIPPPVPMLEVLCRVNVGAIEAFLEWLEGQGIVLCSRRLEPLVDAWCMGQCYGLILETRRALLYRYLGIDEATVERERRAVLDYHRDIQAYYHTFGEQLDALGGEQGG